MTKFIGLLLTRGSGADFLQKNHALWGKILGTDIMFGGESSA